MWCWRSISCFRLLASLLYMSICAGVVVAVALKQIDNAPNAEARAQRDNEGLENTNRRIEKCHKKLLSCRSMRLPQKGKGRSCRQKSRRILPAAAWVWIIAPGGGAYHVASVYVSDCVTTSLKSAGYGKGADGFSRAAPAAVHRAFRKRR